ncbi:MAG: putative toxin-antitoxin system toxin component, PIN family [Candidatus Paceibacterota bacterium]
MKNKKVILDTNLWISFLISKQHSPLDELLLNGKIKLVFSEELIEEFLTVAKRPKFEKYFSDKDIHDLLQSFDSFGELFVVSSEITGCRDSKDNFLLNLAVDSKADFLITGDDDLLSIKKINKTSILNWTDFLKKIK